MPIEEKDLLEYLKHPILFPQEFKDWIGDYYATNLPKIHVSQIYGFKLLSAHIADDVAAAQTPSGTAWQDLATVGPTLAGLSNGFYLVLYGAHGSRSVGAGGQGIEMSFAVNGSTADSGSRQTLWAGSEVDFSAGRAVLLDLSAQTGNNNHELKAKYRENDAAVTGTFKFRWLHALRVAFDDS